MEWWHALILGLVEGLTEYLPVSSTGHLILTERLLGIGGGEAAHAFAIVIQAGAILAVLGLYRKRVAQMFVGLGGRDPSGFALALKIVVAFVPAAVLGLLFDDAIERVLFGLWPVAIAWIAGALVLFALARKRWKRGAALEELALVHAFVIGLMQSLALCPGVSRSLAAILGGLLVGLSLAAAVEFSFLLGVLTLLAASGYKAIGSAEVIARDVGGGAIVIGILAAWVSAVLSVRWMIAWLQHRGLGVFAWWRLLLGLAVIVLLLTGRISSV